MLPSSSNGFVWPLGIPKPHAAGGAPALSPSSLDAFGFGGSSPTGNPSGQGLAGIGTAPGVSTNVGANFGGTNFGGINFGANSFTGLSASVPGTGINFNISPTGTFSPSANTGSQFTDTAVNLGKSALGAMLGVPTSFSILNALAPAFAGALSPAFAAPGLMNTVGSLISHQMDLNGIPTTNAILSGIMGLTNDPETMNALTQTMSPAEISALQAGRFTQAFGPSGSVFGNTAPGQTSLFGAQGGGFAPGGLGYGGYSGKSGDPNAPGAINFGFAPGQGRGDQGNPGPAGPPGPPGPAPGVPSDEGNPSGNPNGAAGPTGGSGGGGGGGGTFLCTALHKRGLMDDATLEANHRFARTMTRQEYAGYATWARPLAAWADRHPIGARVLYAVLGWMPRAYMQEIRQPGSSRLGRVILSIGLRICGRLGTPTARRRPA